jgi:hypothetical protein
MGRLGEVGDELGGVGQSLRREPIARPAQNRRQGRDHDVATVGWARCVAAVHRAARAFRMTSGCFDQ